jgi:hypothetical protein
MTGSQLCQTCRNLNLRIETFIDSSWWYPTSLECESSDDKPSSDLEGQQAQQVSKHYANEFLDGNLDYPDERLDERLTIPTLDGDEGSTSKRLPSKQKVLGNLSDIVQKASWCAFCALVAHVVSEERSRKDRSPEHNDPFKPENSCEITFEHDIQIGSEYLKGPDPDDKASSRERYICTLNIGDNMNMAICPLIEDAEMAWFGGRLYASQIDFSLAHRWLHACETMHPNCGNRLWHSLVKRVPRLRVIDVENNSLVDIAPDTRYVALSYVWGSVPMFMTKKDLLDGLYEENGLGNYMHEVSVTVRDAIQVVRELGERYLWTDSICIIQDDQADKDELIKRMDAVYTSAVLTIVAAEGINAAAGLPGLHPNTRSVPRIFKYSENLKFFKPRAQIEDVLIHCPWVKRGWTYQEAELSSRLLIFTNDTVHFACASTTWSEDLNCESEKSPPPWRYAKESGFRLRSGLIELIEEPDNTGKPIASEFKRDSKFEVGSEDEMELDSEDETEDDSGDEMELKGSNSEDDVDPEGPNSEEQSISDCSLNSFQPTHIYSDPMFLIWQEIPKQMSTRSLSYETDILFASEGIFNLLQEFYGVSFLYGSPEPWLEESLYWYAGEPGNLRRRVDAAGNGFNPSWSWSGWVGKMEWMDDEGPARPEDELTVDLFKLQSPDGLAVPLNRSLNGGLLSLGSDLLSRTEGESKTSQGFPFLLLDTWTCRFQVSKSPYGPQYNHNVESCGLARAVLSDEFYEKCVFCVTPCGNPQTVVGFVIEDSEGSFDSDDDEYEFVLISQGPRAVFKNIYNENEPLVGIVYDVLAVRQKGSVSERIGYGRLGESSWVGNSWQKRQVVLG